MDDQEGVLHYSEAKIRVSGDSWNCQIGIVSMTNHSALNKIFFNQTFFQCLVDLLLSWIYKKNVGSTSV